MRMWQESDRFSRHHGNSMSPERDAPGAIRAK
jgi:hypothetical protein